MSLSEILARPSSRPGWLVLLLIFAAAFAIRLIYLFQIAEIPTFDNPDMDEHYHVELAQRINDAGYGNESFFRAPFYLYFLAATTGLTGGSLYWARFIQILLGGLPVCSRSFRAINRILVGSNRSILSDLPVLRRRAADYFGNGSLYDALGLSALPNRQNAECSKFCLGRSHFGTRGPRPSEHSAFGSSLVPMDLAGIETKAWLASCFTQLPDHRIDIGRYYRASDDPQLSRER
jgi:hypothetical protein